MNDRRPQLRTSPNLALTQRLALTPALLQKIELLTLSKVELEEMLTRELTENPVLEECADSERQESSQSSPDARDAKTPAEKPETAEPQMDNADYQNFFDSYLDSGYARRGEYEDSDKPSFETFLAKPTTLYDHLYWQLSMSKASERTREITEQIIGNLDENGYLHITMEELCQLAACTAAEGEETLRLVQSFDPIGVAARDLRECLLIQLRSIEDAALVEEDAGTRAEKIIDQYLPLVQHRKLKEIAKTLNCELEEVKEALKVIQQLIPKPGLKYNPANAHYVQPEVYVTKVDDEYVILLNEDGMPMLRLNPKYKEMLGNGSLSGEAKSFIREKIQSAMELLRSVNQRRETIYKVCQCIVRRQKEFLEYGLQQLHPMLIKEVAEEIGVHPSTISRVVTNKYIHTPQGVMELRKFFTSGMERSDGEKLSSVQIKYRIGEIIGQENRENPYSDEEIVKILGKEKIVINRRTIAKYRDQMAVAGSRERKMSYSM
jgi:RNA polymerase sigma-54 factor